MKGKREGQGCYGRNLFVLKVTIEYKVAETEIVDLDLFVLQYLSPEEVICTIALQVLLAS